MAECSKLIVMMNSELLPSTDGNIATTSKLLRRGQDYNCIVLYALSIKFYLVQKYNFRFQNTPCQSSQKNVLVAKKCYKQMERGKGRNSVMINILKQASQRNSALYEALMFHQQKFVTYFQNIADMLPLSTVESPAFRWLIGGPCCTQVWGICNMKKWCTRFWIVMDSLKIQRFTYSCFSKISLDFLIFLYNVTNIHNKV